LAPLTMLRVRGKPGSYFGPSSGANPEKEKTRSRRFRAMARPFTGKIKTRKEAQIAMAVCAGWEGQQWVRNREN
jgi:hypothetical protein